MAEMWFYTNEGKQMDPVPIKELKRMVSDGVLKPTDMVWKDGMPRWIRASSVNELYPDPTASLDQYFSTGKDKRPTGAGAPPVAASGAVTAPAAKSTSAPASAGEGDDTRPRVNKRRTASDDANDDERHSKASKKGGSNLGIIITVILGVGLLLVALVVGVIILVVATQQGPNPDQARGALPGDFDPVDPKGKRDPEIPKEPPLAPDEKTGSGVVSSIKLAPGQEHVFKARVKARVKAEGQPPIKVTFKVTTHPPKARPESNHLFILKESNDTLLASDTKPAGKAEASFVPLVTETVRVRVVNKSETPTRVSIHYDLGP